MAEKITLARPYAEAAFQLARDEAALDRWSNVLALLAAVATDPAIAGLVADPRLERGRLAQLVLEICGDRLDQQGVGFVRLLLANRRFGLLPDIAAYFERLKADTENRTEVEMEAAFEIGGEEAGRIARELKQKLKREIHVTARADRSLIGGARLRIGDRVVDGSIKGRLRELSSYLSR